VIDGIGRARCEPSFNPDLIDRAIPVPDAASIGAARVLSRRLGRPCGGSTGTNLWACAQVIEAMAAAEEAGSVVTLLCDSGERYRSTLGDEAWLRAAGIDTAPYEAAMEAFFETGRFAPP
jgi:cysteine synthase A